MCSARENETKLTEKFKRDAEKISDEVLEDIFERNEESCIKNRICVYQELDDRIIYVTRGVMGQCVKCPSYSYKVWVSYCEVNNE